MGTGEYPAPVAIPTLAGAFSLGVAAGHACIRRPEGTVSCARGLAAPVEIGLLHVRELYTGDATVCAIDGEGAVHCFEPGTPKSEVPAVCAPFVATPTPPLASAPKAIAGLSDIAQLAIGRAHACARARHGAVWCWGENHYGQLGDGTRTTRETPVRVLHIVDATDLVVGGERSCARTAAGSIMCWGRDLLEDALYHALTGEQPTMGPPSKEDSLVPEALRVSLPMP